MGELDADALVVRAVVVERIGQLLREGGSHLPERRKAASLAAARGRGCADVLAHELGVLDLLGREAGGCATGTARTTGRQRGRVPDAQQHCQDQQRHEAGAQVQ